MKKTVTISFILVALAGVGCWIYNDATTIQEQKKETPVVDSSTNGNAKLVFDKEKDLGTCINEFQPVLMDDMHEIANHPESESFKRGEIAGAKFKLSVSKCTGIEPTKLVQNQTYIKALTDSMQQVTEEAIDNSQEQINEQGQN